LEIAESCLKLNGSQLRAGIIGMVLIYSRALGSSPIAYKLCLQVVRRPSRFDDGDRIMLGR
jgi:hypothetical protein